MVAVFEVAGRKCVALVTTRAELMRQEPEKMKEAGEEGVPLNLHCPNCRAELLLHLKVRRETSFVEFVRRSLGFGKLGREDKIQHESRSGKF